MPQGRNKALPPDTREYPEYEYHEFPKNLGGKYPSDHPEFPGQSIIAEDADHEADLREQFPDLPPFEVNIPVSGSDALAMRKRIEELEAENNALKHPELRDPDGDDPFNEEAESGKGGATGKKPGKKK